MALQRADSKIIRSLRGCRRWERSAVGCGLCASMTVEAAFVLPLFIFFVVNVLYLFNMITMQCRITAALHETGNKLCMYAYWYRYGTGDEDGGISQLLNESGMAGGAASLLLSETFVRRDVEQQIGRELMDNSCLDGGAASVSYLRSQIMRDDGRILLVADYRVKLLIPMGNLSGISLSSRYCGHGWIGYGLESGLPDDESSGADKVYITPGGAVYHIDRNCTYLQPRLETVSADEIDGRRSRDGSKYYPCESCHPSRSGDLIITPDGNRYHQSAACSALHRDVVETDLQEIEGRRRPCTKCGGSH